MSTPCWPGPKREGRDGAGTMRRHCHIPRGYTCGSDHGTTWGKSHINGISWAQRWQRQPVGWGQAAPHQHSPVNSSSTPLGQPPALIPTHRIRLCLLSYPQNEAVRPRHSPRGWAGGANAARLPSRVNLHQRTRCELHPTTR